MKVFTISFLFLFAAGMLLAQNDTIPNPGFESWTYNPSPVYNTPDQWTTLNPLTSALNVITCYKDSSVVHSGHYSIQLVTKSVAGHTAPGLVTTGTVNAGSGNISGGIPINSRPVALQGWFEYAPSGSDSAQMSIVLTKWDAAGDSEILVGYADYYAGSAVNSWTQFGTTVTYLSNAVPDTVLLLFFASGSSNPQVGSKLWLDDLSYSYYPLDIAKTQNTTINVYPNPASSQIIFDNQSSKAQTLNLYAASGQVVKSVALNEGINTIDVKNLAAGYYIIGANAANGVVYHSSIIIEK